MPVPATIGMTVRFHEKKTADVQMQLRRWGTALDDLRPIWNAFVPEISRAVAANFERQGSPFSPWQPLTPEYRAAKLRAGYPDLILQRTGRMRQVAIAPGESENGILTRTRTRLEYGLTGIVPKVHDVYGVKRRDGRVVREFMTLDKEAVMRLRRLTRTQAEAAIKRARRGS